MTGATGAGIAGLRLLGGVLLIGDVGVGSWDGWVRVDPDLGGFFTGIGAKDTLRCSPPPCLLDALLLDRERFPNLEKSFDAAEDDCP